MKKKIILTDVDGVLLSWIKGFDKLMVAHGHERVIEGEYNLPKAFGVSKEVIDKIASEYVTSDEFSALPPILGSKKAVRHLHENHGYEFHFITTVGAHPKTRELRLKNLQDIYGKSVIHDLHCVDHNEDKKKVLENYRGSGLHWIEDHPENYEFAHEFGLNGLLMHQEWNKDYEEKPNTRINHWKEIVHRLTGETL